MNTAYMHNIEHLNSSGIPNFSHRREFGKLVGLRGLGTFSLTKKKKLFFTYFKVLTIP